MSLWKLLTAAYNSSGDNAKVRIDASTSSLQTIGYTHHEIHSGSGYFIADVVQIAINNVRDIQITTPNTTKWAHVTFVISTESETRVHLYENVTINTAGTGIPRINSNRNSGNTSDLTIAYIDNTTVANANADTAVAGSTDIFDHIVGAGKDEGEATHELEIILKQNEDYCLRFEATAAGFVNYSLNWYEHTDHN